ncbi:unnamed protein product [Calypogeia fissa]
MECHEAVTFSVGLWRARRILAQASLLVNDLARDVMSALVRVSELPKGKRDTGRTSTMRNEEQTVTPNMRTTLLSSDNECSYEACGASKQTQCGVLQSGNNYSRQKMS